MGKPAHIRKAARYRNICYCIIVFFKHLHGVPDSDSVYVLYKSYDRPTVAAQFNNSNSILNEVKRLIQLRRQTLSLQESAEFELISTDMPYPHESVTFVQKNFNLFIRFIACQIQQAFFTFTYHKTPFLQPSNIRIRTHRQVQDSLIPSIRSSCSP